MTAVEHPLRPEEIMEFLDGELPFERAAIVRSHVASCEACQRISADLTGVSLELSRWSLEDAPRMNAPVHPAGAAKSGESRFAWRSFLTARTAVVCAAGAVLIAAIGMQLIAPPSSQVAVRDVDGRVASGAIGGAVGKPETLEVPVEMRLGGGQPRLVTGVESRPAAVAGGPTSQQSTSGPLIVRTARLRLLTKDFESTRQTVDRAVQGVGGFIGQVDVARTGPESRVLRATLRIPAGRLEQTLTALKGLGEVIEESQGADDVTEQVLDLDARIANSRNTEKRLNDLLLKRTGALADVLAAEREVSRVREEIERLDAQRKNLDRRVTYADVSLQVDEERKATLDMGPLTASARFRNALVDGFRGAFTSVLEVTLLLVLVAPILGLWALLLAWPLRLLLRWTRRVRA